MDIFEKYKIFNIDPSKLRSQGFYKNFVVDERKHFWAKRAKLNKPDSEACCFLCENDTRNEEFLEHDGYKLFKCPNCSLIFANVNVSEGYNETVYDNVQYEEMIKKEVLQTYEYRKNTFGAERLEYILQKCDFDTVHDSLLDLGCGPGYFLKYLKDKHIKSKGLELTDYLVDICREQGLDVEKKELGMIADREFKVITMFDVLEHLSEPKTFFATLNTKLQEGGYVLMYTPNVNSFAFHFQKGKQNLLLPYEHLCFYDKESLTFLARKTGFEIVSIEYYGLDIVDYLAMKEYEDNIQYNQNLKEIIPYLQALIDKCNISNHMRIVMKKV